MNNINKKAAIKYLEAALQETTQKDIMDSIFSATVLGEEAEDNNAMTYYCRAYNITAYGIEHQYRGILSDFYREYGPDPIRKAFTQIFQRYPKGLNREDPSFADMLDTQLRLDAADTIDNADSDENYIDLFGAFNNLFKKPKVKTN